MLRYEAWTAVMREENDEISESKETLRLFPLSTFATIGSGIWQIRQAIKTHIKNANFKSVILFPFALYFTEPQYCRGIHNVHKISALTTD